MRTLISIIIIVISLVSYAQTPVSSQGRQFVFDDVNVITMVDEKILDHQTVVVRNGVITALGKKGSVKFDQNAMVINAAGKFLIPGLAEMHAHIPPSDDVNAMREVLTLFAVNGITTIRGMLGHPKHLEIREQLERGEILGPNFYTTGPSFNGMGVRSPEEGAEMVRRQKEAGYDYLKLHPGLTRPEFDAIASTAKEVNIPFVGHVSYGVGVWHAIESEYSSIDHLDGFVEGLVPGIERIPESEAGLFGMFVADKVDRSQIPKLMRALKDKNVWVVPTQALAERWFSPEFSGEDFKNDPHSVYMAPATRDQWINSKKNLMNNPKYDAKKINDFIQLRRDLILACQKNGVGLLLGCDAPQVFNVPGFSTHHELAYLVKSGLTPYQALLTGTRNVADYLDKDNSGVIRQGAVSDLVLLNRNPLENIENTTTVEGVMIGDEWMDRKFIRASLEKLEK